MTENVSGANGLSGARVLRRLSGSPRAPPRSVELVANLAGPLSRDLGQDRERRLDGGHSPWSEPGRPAQRRDVGIPRGGHEGTLAPVRLGYEALTRNSRLLDLSLGRSGSRIRDSRHLRHHIVW